MLIEVTGCFLVQQSEGFRLDFFPGLAEGGLGAHLFGNGSAGEDFEKFIEFRLVGTFQKITEKEDERCEWQ